MARVTAGGDMARLALSNKLVDGLKTRDELRRMLIEQYKLTPDTLIAVGFGKEQLKNAANPFAGENRRVQIVNTTVRATAGR